MLSSTPTVSYSPDLAAVLESVTLSSTLSTSPTVASLRREADLRTRDASLRCREAAILEREALILQQEADNLLRAQQERDAEFECSLCDDDESDFWTQPSEGQSNDRPDSSNTLSTTSVM
ncbi:hypothetical protein HWV62_45711, partial [Athelia sp. TMB]